MVTKTAEFFSESARLRFFNSLPKLDLLRNPPRALPSAAALAVAAFLVVPGLLPGVPARASGARNSLAAVAGQCTLFTLTDSSTGNVFAFDATTGQYQFTGSSDGFKLAGTGVVGLVNGIQTLRDFKADRRISAGFNTGQLTGSATICSQTALSTSWNSRPTSAG